VEELGLTEVEDWLGHVIEAPPGAVVLDVEPDAERGWELMRAIKAHPLTHEVPVVFYRLLGKKGGGSALALDYLTKPATPEALARALERQGLACDASQGCTVLVVDDAPLIVDLHAQMVRQKLPGSRVLVAQNGKAALDIMARERPDLVLLDLMMPEMDGFAVLEAMRARGDQPLCEGLRDVPVVVVTA
jgi:CheY-like chemotaxis protein